MDPLSDVLALLRPVTYVTGGLTAGGPWAVAIPEHQGIKCYSVARGECWLAMDGIEQPFHLATGSCLLLPHGRAFRLASDLALPPVSVLDLAKTRNARTNLLAVSPGDDLLILGSHFALEGDARFLLDTLPPVVMLVEQAQKEALRWGVERMVREMHDPQPGSALIAQQIAYTMLVEALRLYLAEDLRQGPGPGWLRALADPRMRLALAAIHHEPALAWTLQALAEASGMSRTAFAQAFKSAVGKAPMEYLTEWRMTLAVKRMHYSRDTLFTIAPALGYRSEGAFSVAFKRHWGMSLRQYVRAHRLPAR